MITELAPRVWYRPTLPTMSGLVHDVLIEGGEIPECFAPPVPKSDRKHLMARLELMPGRSCRATVTALVQKGVLYALWAIEERPAAYTELARLAGCSPTCVCRSLDVLVRRGLVVVLRQPRGGLCGQYAINWSGIRTHIRTTERIRIWARSPKGKSAMPRPAQRARRISPAGRERA